MGFQRRSGSGVLAPTYLSSGNQNGQSGVTGGPGPKTFVSGAAASGPGFATSVTVTAPTGIVAGNLLLACLFGFGTTSAFTVPSGFTLAGNHLSSGSDGGTAFYTKTAGGAEPGSYAFSTPGSGGMAAAILQIAGWSALDGSPAFTPTTTNTNPQTAPSVTATQGNDLWVTFFGNASGALISTPPTGFSSGPFTRTTGNEANYTFYKTLPASGASGTATVTAAPATASTGCSILIK